MNFIEWFDLVVDIWVSIIFPIWILYYLDRLLNKDVNIKLELNSELIKETIDKDNDGK